MVKGICFCETICFLTPLTLISFSVSSRGVTPATGGTTCTMAHHSMADMAMPPQCHTQTCTPQRMARTPCMATSS